MPTQKIPAPALYDCTHPLQCRMSFDMEGGCWVANDTRALLGWSVLGVEQFKPGVQIVTICRHNMHDEYEMRAVYMKNEHTPWGHLTP